MTFVKNIPKRIVYPKALSNPQFVKGKIIPLTRNGMTIGTIVNKI
jgi:hypothetical protein